MPQTQTNRLEKFAKPHRVISWRKWLPLPYFLSVHFRLSSESPTRPESFVKPTMHQSKKSWNLLPYPNPSSILFNWSDSSNLSPSICSKLKTTGRVCPHPGFMALSTPVFMSKPNHYLAHPRNSRQNRRQILYAWPCTLKIDRLIKSPQNLPMLKYSGAKCM